MKYAKKRRPRIGKALHRIGKDGNPVKERHINVLLLRAQCPICYSESRRHSKRVRRLFEIGLSCETDLMVHHGMYYCPTCNKHFPMCPETIAPKHSGYTARVIRAAIDLVESGSTYAKAAETMYKKYFVDVSHASIHEWKLAKDTKALETCGA